MSEGVTPQNFSQRPPRSSVLRTGLRKRLNTPYTRTPKCRTLRGFHRSLNKSTSFATAESIENLQGLLKKTWKVFHLSPLYKFSCRPSDLKQYSTNLTRFIQSETQKAVEESSGSTIKAFFSVYSGLKVTPADPPALKLVLRSVQRKKTNRRLVREEKIHLTAVFFATELAENPIAAYEDYFMYYPVMICKGLVGHTRLLCKWLEIQFDCKTRVSNFSSLELAWMAAMWGGCAENVKSKPVELYYSVPDECVGLKNITYTINAVDCKEIWESIHNADSDEFIQEEVDSFMNCLELHFFRCFKVQLNAMHLTRVGTSAAYVGSDGKIKFFSVPHMLRVLRHLTELAVEFFTR